MSLLLYKSPKGLLRQMYAVAPNGKGGFTKKFIYTNMPGQYNLASNDNLGLNMIFCGSEEGKGRHVFAYVRPAAFIAAGAGGTTKLHHIADPKGAVVPAPHLTGGVGGEVHALFAARSRFAKRAIELAIQHGATTKKALGSGGGAVPTRESQAACKELFVVRLLPVVGGALVARWWRVGGALAACGLLLICHLLCADGLLRRRDGVDASVPEPADQHGDAGRAVLPRRHPRRRVQVR